MKRPGLTVREALKSVLCIENKVFVRALLTGISDPVPVLKMWSDPDFQILSDPDAGLRFGRIRSELQELNTSKILQYFYLPKLQQYQ